MDKQEFIDALPSYTSCSACGTSVDAPIWRVAAFDETEWLGLNVVSCPCCSNIIIGAAGSSVDAQAEAKKIRQKMIDSPKANPTR